MLDSKDNLVTPSQNRELTNDNTELVSADSTLTNSEITILILADASVTEAVALILDPTGWQINWQQATEETEYCHLLSSSLNLVLYDASLEGITVSRAKNLLFAAKPRIPLIVINGTSDISVAVAAIKAGATDYIPKEKLAELPRAIVRALAKPDSMCLWSQCITETEQQLQKLIAENADGIIVVDDQGIVRFINPAALQLFGKSREQLIDESLGFPVVNGDFLEVDIPLSPEKILVAQMRVSRIQWQGAAAFVVSLRDITQLKQAEEERAKLLIEAQAANRAKDEFLAVLSHELRTPLNPIVGWSQLLLQGNLSPAQAKKGAEIIQRNAMLQTRLIGDILDISRIIRGKLKLEAAPIDLINTIENALDTVNLAAQAKSIHLETELDENVGLVRGDSTRLQQIVWNLLSNAVKFTPNAGRVKVSLTTITSKTDNSRVFAKIKIEDSGKGIKPEFIPYVFDYFRQAESTESRSEGGLGLGLAIVRRLVELHGGEVSVNSPGLGKGTTFTVVLPLLDA